MELSTIGVDIQAVLGSAFALQILFAIPVWAGIVITVLSSFLLCWLFYWRGGMVETICGVCVGVLVICFIASVAIAAPPAGPIFQGWAAPLCAQYHL